MARAKKSNKRSVKESMLVATGVLVMVLMVLCTCVATSSNPDESQEGLLSVIGKLASAFADPENSSGYENMQLDNEKSKEAGEKADSSPLDEQLNNTIISSTKEEKKETPSVIDKAFWFLNIDGKECRREANILKEINSVANSVYRIFLERDKKLACIKKMYDNHNSEYELECVKLLTIGKEIRKYYSNPHNTTQIPENTCTEYDIKRKKVNTMHAEIDKLKKDATAENYAYEKAHSDKKELEKDMEKSRNASLEYHSQVLKTGEKLDQVMECKLHVLKAMYARNEMSCSLREKEKCFFAEIRDTRNSLGKIVKLHKDHMECINSLTAILTTRHSIQKDFISVADQVYSTYKAYDAIKNMYEKQETYADMSVKILYKVEEALENIS
ncbi:hypothetical protein NERG_02628 [Nematocida ausubeli]|uniref:Uncharacterized protein n=1 Tax=Nematocida ausubeli (strain ATCC PRA-371 / ERTm2) TaxID=1913371 RepID=H8ZGA7_NEMA1|nr:hypothetical protein NERG_02628 [Nematocida ausubeli]